MGYCMFLLKDEKKEAFDLGKTRDGVYNAFGDLGGDDPPFVLGGLEDVLARLRAKNDPEDPWSEDYLAWLSVKISTWAGTDQVQLVGEDVYYDRDDLVLTGSRYVSEWSGDRYAGPST